MRIKALFEGATRHGSTVNSNPVWDIHTDHGTFRTQSDSAVGYSINNYNRPAGRLDGLIGAVVILTTTRAGRVTRIEKTGTDK